MGYVGGFEEPQGKDSRGDWLAYSTSELPRLARRNRSSTRCPAEADAPCQYLDHDECVRWRFHGRKAQSEHIRRAPGFLSKNVQIAKGRLPAALAEVRFSLNGLFWTRIENPKSP